MRTTWWLVFFIFISISGCKSANSRSNSALLEEQLTVYIKAKTDASCEGFSKLAQDDHFPLRDLARLRAEEACLKGPIEISSYPSWLRAAALDAAIRSAQKRQDFAQIALLSIEKSKQPLTSEERLEWAQLAKQIAETLHDQDLTEQADARVYLISPRLKTDPSEKEFLSVADDSRYHRDFSKANEFYQKVLGSQAAPLKEKISAFKGLRLSYKNSRDQDKFIATNASLIAFIEKQLRRHKGDKSLLKQLADSMSLQARSLWTHGQDKEALKVIARAEKRLRNRWPLTDIYWVRARMAEEKSNNPLCARYLDKALAQGTTDGDTKDKLIWVRGWIAKRDKDDNAAAAAFEQLANETQNESTRHRAHFWLAKVKMDLKQTDEAKSIWDKLTQDDPLGYYGLLSYYELGKPLQAKATAASTTTESAEATQKEVRKILKTEITDSLIRVSELDVLQSYLDEATKDFKKSKTQSDGVWLTILQYYARAGLYLKLYENLNAISPEQRNSILQNHPELLFPRPFDQEITAAASQFGVEPELMYSIIRQESAFNPRARSSADAFGLMQVLPEIAQDLSKKYNLGFSKSEQLYDPAMNVRFGAALLHDQFQKYHDQFILAVASYNANDRAIQNWMASRFKGDALEFIEDIPYEETRGYVRLVMRNLIFYRLLTSKDATISFPQNILKLSSSH
jgi:soluble lytic murein transglycosylase